DRAEEAMAVRPAAEHEPVATEAKTEPDDGIGGELALLSFHFLGKPTANSCKRGGHEDPESRSHRRHPRARPMRSMRQAGALCRGLCRRRRPRRVRVLLRRLQ